MVVSFKIAISGSFNSNGDIGYLDLGSMATLQPDYNATTPSVGITNRITLKGGGLSAFKLQLNGTNSSTYPVNGAEVQVKWYLNHTGSSVNYQGPDLSAQTLAAGKCDLWVNGTKIFDDYDRNTAFGSTVLTGVRFRVTTDQPITMTIDDLDLSSLP
jgi:hypothetical protein